MTNTGLETPTQYCRYNHKSDMWAAGCVLYELCCLKHPFDAVNLSALVVQILQGKYSPIPRYAYQFKTHSP